MLPIQKMWYTKPRLLQLCARGIYRELRLPAQQPLQEDTESKKDPKVLALRNKLIHCDYLDFEKISTATYKYMLKRVKALKYQKAIRTKRLTYEPVFSVTLDGKQEKENPDMASEEECLNEKQKPIYMPYGRTDSYETKSEDFTSDDDGQPNLLNEDYKVVYEKYLEVKKAMKPGHTVSFEDYVKDEIHKKRAKGETWKVPPHWMTDYEQFDDSLLAEEWSENYGTPDPSSSVSSIACGGCGALLHCKDPEIPGYLPSELFSNKQNKELKAMICQRCHFLKVYNASLEVKVSADEYSQLIKVIKEKTCAVILMVDLTDFPCSIWPDIKSVLRNSTKVFVVGNKIDLLPRDSSDFLYYVKNYLLNVVHHTTGIKRKNIVGVSLVSAKTGFGIEQLINQLHIHWRYKGDVYLIGCTNVGKSSLFNALLASDYCKVQAVNLVQRATTSPWPGTTINLLKFPILKPSPRRLSERVQRLQGERMYNAAEEKYRMEKFKQTRNLKYATLEGPVRRTFDSASLTNVKADPFAEALSAKQLKHSGLNEILPEYRESRWFYDTPGTIHTDQVLDLLTTDELMATLPQAIISPRSFAFKPEHTMFLAGLGRLDFLEGTSSFIRCTLFASSELPLTICRTEDADEIYKELLQTEAFIVPVNDPERLKLWPSLESKEVVITGIHYKESAADVVLSSAGWVAVTPEENERVTFRAWTPQGRGIHVRTPALLRKSVALRGYRIPNSLLYRLGNQAYRK